MARSQNRQLPVEAPAPISWSSVARICVGTVVVVAVFNLAALWYLKYYTPNTGYLIIREKWNRLQSLAAGLDLLILGDSSGNQGVDPEVLKDSLELSAGNFCVIGDAMALNDAWMLDEYVVRYGSPKAALIIHAYDTWSREININVLAQIPGSWWDRLPRISLSIDEWFRLYLDRYMPLYSENQSLTNLLMLPWTAFETGMRLDEDGFEEETRAHPKRLARDLKAHLESIRTGRGVLSEDNRRALEQIGRLAANHRFDVFVALGPVYDQLSADSAWQIYYGALVSSLDEVIGNYPRLHLINDPPMTFSGNELQSVDHVIASAARKFTAQLADEIGLVWNEPR